MNGEKSPLPRRANGLRTALLLVVFSGALVAIWLQRDRFSELYALVAPCQRPIGYSLGAFDERFAMDRQEFLSAVADAEKIWEEPFGKELFATEEDGSLKINLIYDHRQEATEKMRAVGVSIEENEKSYEQVKEKYEQLKDDYDRKKASLDVSFAAFETRRKAYERDLAYWNSRGGAPPDEYRRMEKERIAINAEADRLNAAADELNRLVDTINAATAVLNRLVNSLNLQVDEFNEIGGGGEEFQEGAYVQDASGTRIDIFQFDDRTMLVRLLAHELGHALGMVHVDDAEAIMYTYNSGRNDDVTAADLQELRRTCKVKD